MKTFREFLSESKQRLHEGAWALPNTTKRAKDLEKLFKSPLTAKIAKNKLYDLFGDDHLFDILDDYIKDGDNDLDVRNVIKDELEIMLNDYIKRPKDFLVKFDDEAIKILNNIVKNTLKRN